MEAFRDTPYVEVDLDVMEANLRRMADRVKAAGLRLNPHTKTHKQPAIAWRQHRLGAERLTVAKLGEAAILLEAGLTNLLIAYPLVGPVKAHRLATLMTQGLTPTVAIDSTQAMETVALAARLADRPVDVLVEVDSGFHRTGLPPGQAVVDLALAISRVPQLQFCGLMAYAGHIAGETDPERIRRIVRDEDALLGEQVAELQQAGLDVATVSVGGTVLSHHLDLLHHATEVRPGMYVFNDMGIVERGAATVSDCALRVAATVISRPALDRAVLDAGSKTLSTDGPVRGSYGYVVEHPDWRITRLSEEHAVVDTGADSRVRVGDVVHVIPNHVCTVVNLHDQLIGVRQGRVEALWPVVARGRVR